MVLRDSDIEHKVSGIVGGERYDTALVLEPHGVADGVVCEAFRLPGGVLLADETLVSVIGEGGPVAARIGDDHRAATGAAIKILVPRG